MSWKVPRTGGGRHSCNFYDVISVKSLLQAWKKFSRGKRSNKDVAAFEINLENNIFKLHEDLTSASWKPDPYKTFYVQDPKLRKISKASVRDRILYQAVYQILYRIFDNSFIHDSYASRKFKGTHAGVKRFEAYAKKITQNHTKPAYTLKCDIRKFFDSIDHKILILLIKRRILDEKFIQLVICIIESFNLRPGVGLPLGNVTSQICSNIYLNELDQFAKHILKIKYYIRYCDDFVIIHDSKEFLEKCISEFAVFLDNHLKIQLHPNKVSVRKIHNGVDFLGYVSLPHRLVMRISTKKRILRKIQELMENLQRGIISQTYFDQALTSYKGMLKHCKSEKLQNQIGRIIGS